ncbi:MAG TPA: hypothetical protein VNX40_05420 [Mucilaginibacter sp.]|jgi:hypothetical protein|nr:hypothetical protein [Mucilaginibacter sp.]
MKKYIKVGLLVCMGLLAFSRPVKAQDFAGKIQDSLTHTNAMADTVFVTIPLSRTAITFKYDIIASSGTVAGTIVLQAVITNPALTGEQWTTLNSYTLTNATTTNSVTLTANNYVKYRIITTTTGTSVSIHNKYLLYRKLTL